MPMDRDDLLRRVSQALTGVAAGEGAADVFSSGRVLELEVDEEGVVRFQFNLGPDDAGTLVREARRAVEAVEGVSRVKIDVKLPRSVQAPGQRPRQTPAAAPAHSHAPGTVPTPSAPPGMLPGVHHFVAVSSGKGGVGKSTVAANLAVALAARGLAVGLLDADIYGPDIPLMFGERRRPKVTGTRGQERIVPLEAHGVKLMSLGFLLEEDQPAIMRGPLVSGILKQFLEQVEWGELDYMVVDMPPGTGDAQLSLAQTIDVDGSVMVTTPQEVSTGDVRRAVRMWEKVRTRVLGIVENMAGFECSECGTMHDIFGRGGGRSLAEAMELPFLGEVPIDTAVRVAGDVGTPTAIAAGDSPAGRAFREIADRVVAGVEEAVHAGR